MSIGENGIMSTETARSTLNPERETAQAAIKQNLREYGLVLALVAIMLFFQWQTGGVLFKPVNLTNLVLQNSYIIIMALGMLLVIVGGHIDLSVGSVSGFVGARGRRADGRSTSSTPVLTTLICIVVGGLIGAARATGSPT